MARYRLLPIVFLLVERSLKRTLGNLTVIIYEDTRFTFNALCSIVSRFAVNKPVTFNYIKMFCGQIFFYYRERSCNLSNFVIVKRCTASSGEGAACALTHIQIAGKLYFCNGIVYAYFSNGKHLTIVR